jgi:hypothetical protein
MYRLSSELYYIGIEETLWRSMLKRKDNITVTQIVLTSVYWIQRSTGSTVARCRRD